MALNASQLVTLWKAEFREGHITQQKMIEQLRVKTDFKQYFSITATKNTVEDNVKTHLSRVLQRFQPVFTALGNLDFVPEQQHLERLKINVSIKPDELADTAVQFLIDKGIDRKNMTIVQQMSMMLVMQAQEDDELYSAWEGEAGQIITSGTPNASQILAGTPSGVHQERTGLRKKIRNLNAQGRLNVTASGDWTNLTNKQTVEYAKHLYYSIPPKVRTYIKWLATNEDFVLKFMEGQREIHGSTVDAKFQASGKTTIWGTDCEIKQSTAQASSKMIWTSPTFNCRGFIKQPENQNAFHIAEHLIYEVLLATDWYECQGFINGDQVYTNDQEL